MENLITVNEVAKYLGVNNETVYRMCRIRKIPCYKIGRRYLFKMQNILLWLESNAQKVIKDRDR